MMFLYSKKDKWHPIDYYKCSGCHAQQRQTLMWDAFNELELKPKSLLHCSPTKCLEDKWKPMVKNYVSIDFPPRETEIMARANNNIDLTNTPFPDESFDFIVLSHVIDQIKEEKKAIKELYRILGTWGTIFLIVPIYHGEKTTELKRPVINHWRRCGDDYIERYDKFRVRTFNNDETLFVLTK